MNKFFRSLLSLTMAMVAIAMVGCGKDEVDSKTEPQPEPQPEVKSVSFKIEDLEYDSVMITVVPPTEEEVYYAFLYPDTEDFMNREPEEIYVDIRYGDNFEEFLTSGTRTFTFQGLIGHSYYRVVYFVYDEATGRKVGDIYYSERIATPDAPEVFNIEISDIKGMSAQITITPPDDRTTYYYYLYPLADYKSHQHSSDYELMQYDYSFWVYMAAIYEKDVKEVIANDIVTGKVSISTDDILYLTEWNTEYLVWAYGITADGRVTTTMTRKVFKTASPAVSEMTFEVSDITTEWYEEQTSEGILRGWVAEANIVPSVKNERYFATITNKDWYDWYASANNKGRNDEQYIMSQILLNASTPSALFPAMCYTGDYAYNCLAEREILLRPDKEYAVFVFGLDDNGATTGLSVFPFKTGSMPQ